MSGDHQKSTRIVYKWTFGVAQFDESIWHLVVDGEAVPLEHKPLEVLVLLLRNAGEAVTKEELLEAIWGDRPVSEAVLTNAIGKLRRALGDLDQTIITTVPKVGYRLLGKVARTAVARGVISMQLKAGDAVPRQSGWRLARPLDPAERGEVWLAENLQTREQCVYKFSFDGSRLYALKREVTISRLFRESLGQRPEFIPVTGWDFAEAPYFIQSPYGGLRLDEWAQARGGLDAVPLDERIELIAKVADAIATAHEIGVLHKDMKPANLLVNGSPGNWQPSLVDFGSGRVLEPERLEALGITRLGLTGSHVTDADSLTGTLLYLAPELLSGQVPTVRSDIYALGILLYQICVGDFRRPMSSGWEEEIEDAMLREDIAAAANGNPELRFASARELATRLRNREQRARQREQELAAARQAAINQRALAASQARRPWMLASMCALAIGFMVTWHMYRVAAEANTRAAREMQVAQSVNDFLNRDLLATANPVHGGRANITLLEAIHRAEPAIDARFASDPRVAATLHQTLGDAYLQLADSKGAHAQYVRAATLFAQDGDGAPVRVAMAQLAQVRALGRNAAAQRLDDIWPEVMRLSNNTPTLYAEAYRTRGAVAISAMRYEEAIPLLEEALRTLASTPDPDPYTLRAVKRDLNRIRIQESSSPQFAREQQQALEDLAKENGELTLKALQARQQLISIQVKDGKLAELEPAYLELVADYAHVMGPDHNNTLRTTLGLVSVYNTLERGADAEHHARPVYEAFLQRHGPAHRDTLNAAHALSNAERQLGRLDTAQTLLEAGIGHLEGKDDNLSQVFLGIYQASLARLRLEQGRSAEAQTLLSTVEATAPAMLMAQREFKTQIKELKEKLALTEGD